MSELFFLLFFVSMCMKAGWMKLVGKAVFTPYEQGIRCIRCIRIHIRWIFLFDG